MLVTYLRIRIVVILVTFLGVGFFYYQHYQTTSPADGSVRLITLQPEGVPTLKTGQTVLVGGTLDYDLRSLFGRVGLVVQGYGPDGAQVWSEKPIFSDWLVRGSGRISLVRNIDLSKVSVIKVFFPLQATFKENTTVIASGAFEVSHK
jgi:hypothetical protein